MGYANFQQLQQNLPGNYAQNTTREKLSEGLQRVAPPGGTPQNDILNSYAQNTDQQAGQKLVRGWARRVFGVEV